MAVEAARLMAQAGFNAEQVFAIQTCLADSLTTAGNEAGVAVDAKNAEFERIATVPYLSNQRNRWRY